MERQIEEVLCGLEDPFLQVFGDSVVDDVKEANLFTGFTDELRTLVSIGGSVEMVGAEVNYGYNLVGRMEV